MSYLVLARRFRPQTFAEIVGQGHVTKTLANAIALGRVHHAFLFCGARGVGKTTAARILAKSLSCVQAPTATPCNACDACNEITAGISVDVQEIDGASNNSVEDIRTLREQIRYLPVRGKKKVYIIDEVHMLSTGAFNALLKTLEEPPPHAVFIFATTEAHKIPTTILSRVQRYDFRLVSHRELVEHLAGVLTEERVVFDPAALSVVAREASGSVRDALSLLEQLLAHQGGEGEPAPLSSEQAAANALGVADRTLVSDLGRAVLARDGQATLHLLDQAVARSIDLRHFTQIFLEHLRNLLVARVVDDSAGLIDASQSELDELRRAAHATSPGLLELLFHRFSRVVEEVARSPLPRYVLEVGLIELLHCEPLQPIGTLIDRLEQLEGRLHTAQPTRSQAAVAPIPAAPSRPREVRPSTTATPAPSAPSPVATAPMTPPASFPNWQALAEALFERSHRFAIFLHGKEVTFAPPRLVVAFKNGYEAAQAKERLADILAAIRELLGMAVTLDIVEGAGAAHAPSAIEADEKRAVEDRERRRKEALEHPARQLIAAQFGDDVTFREPDVE